MSDSSIESSSKPWDRLLSKWTALLAVLLLVGGIAWRFWWPYQRQLWVIQAMRAAGGEFTIGFEPVGPEWLRNLVGDEALQVFGDPTASVTGMPLFGDEGLKHLAHLTNLEYLDLNGTQVSDEGLKHLIGLIRIEWLNLENTQVSDEGVARLRLALPHCEITFNGD